jgi:hypothetical protein
MMYVITGKLILEFTKTVKADSEEDAERLITSGAIPSQDLNILSEEFEDIYVDEE